MDYYDIDNEKASMDPRNEDPEDKKLSDYEISGKKMRPVQKYILEEIEKSLEAGKKNIIICAPTGVGKSFVAKAVADYIQPAFIITSSKQLQDQYTNDFKDVRSIKGKNNFPCYALMEKSGLQMEYDDHLAMKKGLTCNYGKCKDCLHKDSGDIFGQTCAYYRQRDIGLSSYTTILNYSIYFSLKMFASVNIEPGMYRETIIYDEAHTMEDEIVRFAGYDITRRDLETTELAEKYDSFGRKKLNVLFSDISKVITLFESVRDGYVMLLAKGPGENMTADTLKAFKRYEERYTAISDILKLLHDKEELENLVIQNPTFNSKGEFTGIQIVPLDIKELASKLLGYNINIFMSATISPDEFAKTLGIKDYAVIDVPKSPFRLENRRLEMENIAYLNAKSPPHDEKAVIDRIYDILKKHDGERGIILTSSKLRCKEIVSGLGDQAYRVTIAHSQNEDKSTIKDILKRHAKTPGSVLLSSSMWQGVDLKDDLSRFQVIAKCPWLYLGDKRVAKMRDKNPNWYISKTVEKLLQGFGRSIRGPDDYAKTYVLDATVGNLFRRSRKLVPRSYHDILYF